MFKLSNATELTPDNSAYLLYGPSGIGKTHTTHFLEGKTLYVSIDRSERTLMGNENITVLHFNSHRAWTEWQELMKWFAKNEQVIQQFDNIVFDNMSELFRSMLADMGREGKNNRVPTMMNYQQIDFMIIDSVRYILSLNKRIVFYAWETSDQWHSASGQIFNRAYPEMREKIMNNFMGLCQVVGRLQYDPKTEQRYFVLQPTDEVFAKNQLDDRAFCKQEDIFKVGHNSEQGSNVDSN